MTYSLPNQGSSSPVFKANLARSRQFSNSRLFAPMLLYTTTSPGGSESFCPSVRRYRSSSHSSGVSCITSSSLLYYTILYYTILYGLDLAEVSVHHSSSPARTVAYSSTAHDTCDRPGPGWKKRNVRHSVPQLVPSYISPLPKARSGHEWQNVVYSPSLRCVMYRSVSLCRIACISVLQSSYRAWNL